MNKAKVFKVATILLAVSFLVQAANIIGMVFLKGLLMRMGILDIFFEVHEYNGFLFIALVLAHLVFNWGWIKANILKGK